MTGRTPESRTTPSGLLSFPAAGPQGRGSWHRKSFTLPPPRLRTSLLAAAAVFLFLACGSDKKTCAHEELGGGVVRIRCPDGSYGTFIPPETEGAPAVVRGKARRLGDVDGSGIRVSLEPTSETGSTYKTLTDSEGNYEFKDVASGTYHLIFREEAYPTWVLWQVTVLPGTLHPDPVVLRPSFRISPFPAEELIPAPTQDALVALEREGGRLIYWDGRETESLLLGTEVSRPEWLPNGQGVLFLDEVDTGSGAGTLVYFDRERRTSEAILENVLEWRVSADLELIVVEQTQLTLRLWSTSRREVTTVVEGDLSHWFFHPESKIVVATLRSQRGQGDSTTDVVIWDALAESGTLIGRLNSAEFEFSPKGDSLFFLASGSLLHWSRDRRQPERVAPRDHTAAFSPNGRYAILQSRGGSRLAAYDLETRRTRTLSESGVQGGFDPRNGNYWFTESNPRRLLVFNGEDLVEVGRWGDELQFVGPPLFPKESSTLFYALRGGDLHYRLRSWTPAQMSGEIASGLIAMPALVGDDSHLLFQTDRPMLLEIRTGEFVELRHAGAPMVHHGSHPSGLLHYPLTPLYPAGPGSIVGPLTVFDMESGEDRVFVDEFQHASCAFSPVGALYCLNRLSPMAPRGAQITYWNRGVDGLVPLAEGVFDFGFAPEGTRAWFLSQAVFDETAPLLWLHVPSLPAPVAIDEGVELVTLTEGWIAYTVPEGVRAGVHVSLFPRPPTVQSP